MATKLEKDDEDFGKKQRNVVFTLSAKFGKPDIKLDQVVYYCYGHEFSENGYEHYQGVLQLKNAYGLKGIKKILGSDSCYIAKMRGTIEEAVKYCKKDGDYVEYGTQRYQGKRVDLEEISELAKTQRITKIIKENVVSLQQIKLCETIKKYIEPKRMWKTKVIWLWGQPETGKTRYVYDNEVDIYKQSLKKWWEGYDGHEVVLLDDLRPNDYEFQYLLQLLDRYPMRVECKGGSREFLAKTLYITSCTHPRDFIPDHEHPHQLMRRIEVIKYFSQCNGNGKEVEEVTLNSSTK